ncbi:MAG: TRM11 family SAM-dependent methyltransferase, partial [Gemmataceae bacterium]
EVAADEVAARGEVKKTSRGVVVFRLDEIDRRVLTLRTTEDVYLFGWGTDSLTYRAADLESIEKWTAKVDWQHLLRLHHAVRPRPAGKPTYRLVTQMEGKHGYLRRDAGRAMARGLAGVFPESWKPAEEDASIEVWLTIDQGTAVCGLRLSDATMRHRTYKQEHQPASLRPTVAAAMVWLAKARPGQLVLDPMCGAGTVIAEQLARDGRVAVLGGDIERSAVRMSRSNLSRLGDPPLLHWDARRLPLEAGSVDHVVSNPPFGKQLSSPAQVGPLYRAVVKEYDRVLRPGGQAVLLAADADALREAAGAVGWKVKKRTRVLVLGQMAQLSVWRKPARADTIGAPLSPESGPGHHP